MSNVSKVTAQLIDQHGNPYHGFLRFELFPSAGSVGNEIVFDFQKGR